MIPLSVPNMCGDELVNIKECIDTGWLSTSGKFVTLFEEKISKFVGSKYAIACNNGTAALQISLKLIGVIPGDEVIVPSLTFIAPINAIMYNSAKPIFMDCDNFYNIDIKKTIEFIKVETIFKNGFTYNKKTKNRISAIIPVHVWGNAVWLDELVRVCNERNIYILEDASESIGTTYTEGNYKGKHAGTIGRIGCLSFNANKIMTTGGGGMILTNDSEIAKKALYLITQAKDDPIKYIHNEVGYNYRLTNLHAAIGVSQIDRLSSFVKYKKKIHQKYISELNHIGGLNIVSTPGYSNNNYWLNILQIDLDSIGKTLDNIIEIFDKNEIQTRPVWHLNHLQKQFTSFQSYKISNANSLLKNSICIPSGSNLSLKDQTKVINVIKNLNI